MRELAKLTNLSREEWLRLRQKGIGGSDISGVVGQSKWKSALAIYVDKVEDVKVDDQSIAQELGLLLEPYIIGKFEKWFLENEGVSIEVSRMESILQDDEYDYMLVNPDGNFTNPKTNMPEGVECKTTTEYKKDEWAGDNCPAQYYLQCQWGLMITGWSMWWMPVLIGNRIIMVKKIPRNEDVINSIRTAGIAYWENYIIPKIPPAPDGSDSSEEIINALYPKETTGLETELTDEDLATLTGDLAKLDEMTAHGKALESDIKLIKQGIKAKMEDAELLFVGSRKITFKTENRNGYTVKPKSFRVLRIGAVKDEDK